jgi:phosphoribosylglycinamide formyltransferase-1
VSVLKSRQPVVVLISGRGSNMHRLIEQARAPDSPYFVAGVFSDKAAAPGLVLARDLQIPATALPAVGFADRVAYDRALAAQVAAGEPALVVLAGFMRILSADFIARFPGRILNIHPSLLPRHPGLHTHRRVLAAGEHEHGATVHFVTEELDAGPLILQGRVAVAAGDDEKSLAARVQAQEHQIYPLAVRWFCEGRLEQRDGRAWLDGAPLAEPLQLAAVLQSLKVSA